MTTSVGGCILKVQRYINEQIWESCVTFTLPLSVSLIFQLSFTFLHRRSSSVALIMHDSNPTTQDVRTPLLQHQHGTSPVGRPPVSRPKNKRRRSSFDASTYNSTGQSPGYLRSASSSLHDSNGLQPVEHVAPGLTLYQMLSLTVCMAGVQFTCKF